MPKLEVPTGTPDEYSPITPGIHTVQISEIPDRKPTSSGNGENLIISLRIADGKDEGKTLRDYIFLNDRGWIKVKQLLRACGLPETGTDLENILNKTCRAMIGLRQNQDPDTGFTQKFPDIQQYLK